MPYVVHYFLADDTIEVAEMDTSGKDPFPLLLGRCRLPHKLPVVGQSHLQKWTVQLRHMYPCRRLRCRLCVHLH